MTDARFEDGVENPVRLFVEDQEDLPIVSALVQDGLVQTDNISWMRQKSRVALLISRFRWEDHDAAERSNRPFERVQSMLVIDSASSFRAQGISPSDKELVTVVLSVSFEPGKDGAGTVHITLAGDGALAVEVECLDIRLQDVSRPYLAKSSKAPDHEIGG